MIPYNPSSFNSNKTILEQILELKRWLMEHPSYKIYYIFDLWNTITPQYTWNFSDVVGDATNIAEGDVVSFSNPYVASVISVDSANETFTVAPATSYAGPQGPTGATGPQGVSITNVQIDANNDLIVTLSNGNTINAGNLGSGSGAYIIKLTTTSGTLSAEDLSAVNDFDNECIIELSNGGNYYVFHRQETFGNYCRFVMTITSGGQTSFEYFDVHKTTGVYSNDSIIQFVTTDNIDPITATNGQVPTSDGNGHVYWQSIPAPEGTAVKSTGATSGKVLQADGSGGASWEDASGGSVELEIAYADIGQALSDSDYAICQNADKMIVNYGAGQLIEYTRDTESSTDIKFARTYNSGVDVILVTKATKVVTNPTYKFIANSIDSQTATSGQVLQADGNGGASWQNAGGGSTLYQHFVNIFDGTTFSGISFTFISTSNTKINSSSTLANWLYTNNLRTTNFWWGDCLVVYGAVRTGGTTYRGIVGLSSTNGTAINQAGYWADTVGWTSFTYGSCFTSNTTYQDNVIQIS